MNRQAGTGALLWRALSSRRRAVLDNEWAIGPWPDGLPMQSHGMDSGPFFALEGDVDAARELVATVGAEHAELFVYPGDQHLFSDSSLPSYDPDAAASCFSGPKSSSTESADFWAGVRRRTAHRTTRCRSGGPARIR
jgi:hypothetical protein